MAGGFAQLYEVQYQGSSFAKKQFQNPHSGSPHSEFSRQREWEGCLGLFFVLQVSYSYVYGQYPLAEVLSSTEIPAVKPFE